MSDTSLERQIAELREQQIAMATALTQPSPGTLERDQPARTELAGIDRDELTRASETLIRKRTSQTRAILPQSAKILGKRFRSDFREYAVKNHWNGSNAIWMDAILFAAWEEKRVPEPKWLIEILRLEALDAKWHCSRYLLRLMRSHYDLEQAIDIGSKEEPPKKSRILVAWRFGRWGAIWVWR